MEHKALMYTSQPWKGPKGSTFTPNWDTPSCRPTVTSLCPDVVKSPCQHAANICHPSEVPVTSQSQQIGPHASTSSGFSATSNTASRKGFVLDENCEERRAMPQMRTLCLGEEEEEELERNSQSTTEDLFTIIHRSKKKLLGRKETADSRQGYGSPIKGIQGVVQKSSSKNDNFMAFLQRRRSNKPNSGERLSAAELLKSTKPLVGQP